MAGLFPEIWDTASPAGQARAASPELRGLEDRVMNRIRTKDPSFFSRFENEIRSGDHLRVQEALQGASQLVVSDPEIDATLNGTTTAGTALALWVAVVLVVAVMIVAVAEGGAAHSHPPYDDYPLTKDLEAEVAVDLVVTRLGQRQLAASLP